MINEDAFDFKSEIHLNQEDYCSVYNVNFSVFKNTLLILAAVSLSLTAFQVFLFFNYNFTLTLFNFFIALISVFSALKFYEINLSAKRLFAQKQFITGKDTIKKTVIFSEKITVSSDISLPAEFFYSNIKQIFKEKNYYILLLEKNCFLTTLKNPKECNIEGETLLEYLLSECSNLKTTKVKTLTSQKKLCFSLVILMFLFLAIAIFTPSVVDFIKEYLADKLIYMKALN